MVIDFTAQLAPLLWGLLCLLVLLSGAILSCVDPDIAEIYLGDRRLLAVSVALAVGSLAALIAAFPPPP